LRYLFQAVKVTKTVRFQVTLFDGPSTASNRKKMSIGWIFGFRLRGRPLITSSLPHVPSVFGYIHDWQQQNRPTRLPLVLRKQ